MDRDFISHEIAAALGQLLVRRTEQPLGELRALRKVLDEALTNIDTAVTRKANAKNDAELAALVDKLASTAAAESKAAYDRLQSEARHALQAVQSTLDTRTREKDDLTAALKDTRGMVHHLETVLQAERQKVAAATTALADANGARAKAEKAAQDKQKQLETEVQSERQKVASAASELSDLKGARAKAEKAAQESRAQFEAAVQSERQKVAAVTAELAEARGARVQAEKAAQAAEAARQKDSESAKAIDQELMDVRARLNEALVESATLSQRAESLDGARSSLESALREAEARLDAFGTERDAITKRSKLLELAIREREEARRHLQAALDASQRGETMLRERLAAAEAEAKKGRDQLESRTRSTSASAPPAATSTPSAPLEFEPLVNAYQDIESGTSVTSVLVALAKGLHGQFSRVALFNSSANGLEGVYQAGFDIKADISKIVILSTVDSVLTRAASSGVIQTPAPNAKPDPSLLPLGATAGSYLALPVVFGGDTIAVIYADDGSQPRAESSVQAARVGFAELLKRHAIAVLKRLTIDLKTIDELRSYSNMLLDELEYSYSADVRAGKQNAEIVERLTENLRYAHDAFCRRFESTGLGFGQNLFHERVTALVDARASTAFGRHLGIASYAINKPESSAPSSQPAAQAS